MIDKKFLYNREIETETIEYLDNGETKVTRISVPDKNGERIKTVTTSLYILGDEQGTITRYVIKKDGTERLSGYATFIE
jgi:hypothetical protein